MSGELMRALNALGVAPPQAEGLEVVPADTGVVSTRAAPMPPGLPLFGLDVFRGRTTLFQPVLSGPVPPSYRIGPGDVLGLVLTGDVELVHQLSVTREGYVVIPQVGQIFVNNLTMEQLNRVLRQRLGQSYSGIVRGSTKFDVTIGRLRTNQVYVLGEVGQPGAYQLASVATVLNALYAAGGITERGNFREIVVLRRGDTVSTLDFYEYLLTGSAQDDIVLAQGDVVFVPVRGARVSVSGAVVRPGIYELRAGQTLTDLVRIAAGFRADAELRRVAVYRILPAAEREPGPAPRAVIDVPLSLPRAGEDGGKNGGRTAFGGVLVPAFGLENGDSVVVHSVLPVERSLYITITGMVNSPGSYPWSPGMTLRDLVTLAQGPRVGADLREAEIARLPENRAEGQLARTLRVPLDSSYLFERDSSGRYLGAAGVVFPRAGTAPEVPIAPFDLVTIFRQPDFELQRSVLITGEVLYPGTYALTRKDERLSELVQRAGGILPTAFPPGGRFLRDAQRVNVDLARVLEEPGGRHDVILQPGDLLHIPEYTPTVRVEGAVNSPVIVLYREGAGLDYYIANAGGYARNADKGRVSVRYADGSADVVGRFLLWRSAPQPGPGSVVTVPIKPEGEPFKPTEFFAAVAQIVASMVAIVAIATP